MKRGRGCLADDKHFPIQSRTAAPPTPAPSTTASADSVFVYPRQGQSAEQQAADRYACHQWAVSQVGTDPTTGAGLPPQKRADYVSSRRPNFHSLRGMFTYSPVANIGDRWDLEK